MHKSARIQQGLLNHRLFAGLLDAVVLFVSSLILYVVLLYTVFAIFGYVGMTNRISEIEEEFHLTLKEGEDYKVYEEVIQDIYFVKYPEEIKKHYKDSYGDDFSIEHIYNIVILRLPANPTYDNYKTDFFQYNQKEDGSFDVDNIATMVDGSGINFERNLDSLFHSGYKRMSKLVESFNEEYFNLNAISYSYECYARLIAFVISYVFLFIVIPFTNKEGQTLFMKKFDLAYINIKDGYYIKKYKLIIRYLICYILPLIGFILATKYSIIILILGYLLVDNLLILFSNSNLNISDSLLRIETCKLSQSLIFDDAEDEKSYLESEEVKKVLDLDYVEKLEKTEEINLKTIE